MKNGKNDAARGGQPRATRGRKTRERAATRIFTRKDTSDNRTRQQLLDLGARAEHIARRCPNARQRARFADLARFLLDAGRGRRRHG